MHLCLVVTLNKMYEYVLHFEEIEEFTLKRLYNFLQDYF